MRGGQVLESKIPVAKSDSTEKSSKDKKDKKKRKKSEKIASQHSADTSETSIDTSETSQSEKELLDNERGLLSEKPKKDKHKKLSFNISPRRMRKTESQGNTSSDKIDSSRKSKNDSKSSSSKKSDEKEKRRSKISIEDSQSESDFTVLITDKHSGKNIPSEKKLSDRKDKEDRGNISTRSQDQYSKDEEQISSSELKNMPETKQQAGSELNADNQS